MSDVGDRLWDVFGGEPLARLRSRLVQKLSRGRPLTGQVRIDNPSQAERTAIDGLLGRTSNGSGSITVPLERLETTLAQSGLADNLSEAVEAIEGPVPNRRVQRQQQAEAWQSIFDALADNLPSDSPRHDWLEQLQNTGLLRRVSGGDLDKARRLLEQAVHVIDHLPNRGITRPVLAACAIGDSHALDPGHPVAALVARAIPLINQGTGDALSDDDAYLSDPEPRRAAWESVGVFENDLTRAALVLNLPANEQSLTGQVLGLHAAQGEPCRLTLGQLERHPVRLDCNRVYVCENPSVLTVAAGRLGRRCPPMICTDGQPGTAVRRLLQIAAEDEVELRYHGDFDWGGIRIANLVIGQYHAIPWQFDSASYQATIRHATKSLAGQPVDAEWDPELTRHMAEHGLAVHEEAVVEDLMNDLEALIDE